MGEGRYHNNYLIRAGNTEDCGDNQHTKTGSSPLRTSWDIPATPVYGFITRPLHPAPAAILEKNFPSVGIMFEPLDTFLSYWRLV